MEDKRIEDMYERLTKEQELMFSFMDELEEKGNKGTLGWEFGKKAEDVGDQITAWGAIEALLSDALALIQASFLND